MYNSNVQLIEKKQINNNNHNKRQNSIDTLSLCECLIFWINSLFSSTKNLALGL